MDHAAPVDLGDRLGHRDRMLEESRRFEGAYCEKVAEVAGAGIFEDEDRPVVAVLESERAHDADRVEGVKRGPFMAEEPFIARVAAIRAHRLEHDRPPVLDTFGAEDLKSIPSRELHTV